MTVLERPGIDDETFVRLERLSRDAAQESLSARGGYLTDDQFDSLAMHLLELGIRAFERYDVELATFTDPRSGETSVMSRDVYAYRMMRGYRHGRLTEGPYVDWLRTHIRDSRFEPEGSVALTELGVLPESEAHEESELEAVIEHYAGGLSDREVWTLRHVAAAIASGHTFHEVVEGLLRDLADAIRPLMPEQSAERITPDLSSFEGLFADWLKEAA